MLYNINDQPKTEQGYFNINFIFFNKNPTKRQFRAINGIFSAILPFIKAPFSKCKPFAIR